jgi:uncharacterized cupin superfamily protein
MEAPLQVFNVSDLQHEQLISSKSGEMFSRSAILTELLSCRKIFVHHEILSPGKRASSPHRHKIQEEMIFVLEGFPTACLGNQTQQLKPGDFLGFKPGSRELHYIENTTQENVRFLVICSNEEDDQVIVDV